MQWVDESLKTYGIPKSVHLRNINWKSSYSGGAKPLGTIHRYTDMSGQTAWKWGKRGQLAMGLYQGGRKIYRQLRYGQKPYRRRRRYYPKQMFRRGYNRTGGYYRRNGYGAYELKFHDVTLDDALVDTGGTVTATMIIIPQNTTESGRIGRRCIVRQIGWKYRLGLNTSVDPANTSDTCRIILFIDKQCNGATAAVLDILSTADYQSFRSLERNKRFIILMDKLHTLRVTAAGGNGTAFEMGQTSLHGHFYKRLNLPIEYSGTTGGITEIESNNIGVLLISVSGNITFASQMRIRFTG